MTLMFDTEYLHAGQEDSMKVIILANSEVYYLEQRAEELQRQPLILFNLFSDEALQYQLAS